MNNFQIQILSNLKLFCFIMKLSAFTKTSILLQLVLKISSKENIKRLVEIERPKLETKERITHHISAHNNHVSTYCHNSYSRSRNNLSNASKQNSRTALLLFYRLDNVTVPVNFICSVKLSRRDEVV